MRKTGVMGLVLCFALLTACGNEKTADMISETESSSQSTVQETSQTELENEELLYDNTATSSIVKERDTARENAVADTKNADTENSKKTAADPGIYRTDRCGSDKTQQFHGICGGVQHDGTAAGLRG
ncbi:MAG: hypothetical protein V8S26_11075 [Lachnospiraceae bacterium]